MNLKSLIGKLNDPTRGALEAAAGLCLARTHYDIEVEHYLTKLLDSTDNDVAAIFKHFEIDTSRLSGELARALDKLKTGNARTPALSPTLMRMLIEAWTIGSIDYNAGQVRTGFTILALATNDELVRLMRDISREFQKIQADALRKDFRFDRRQFERRGAGGRGGCCGGTGRAICGPTSRRQDSQPRPVHDQSHRESEDRQDRSGAGTRF